MNKRVGRNVQCIVKQFRKLKIRKKFKMSSSNRSVIHLFSFQNKSWIATVPWVTI